MKQSLKAVTLASMLLFAGVAEAWWGNDNWRRGYYGGYYDDWNDWPEWTPMYWMEEFADGWDDDDYGWGYRQPWGYGGGGPWGYGAPWGYGGGPWGGGYPPGGYYGPAMPPYGGYPMRPIAPPVVE